MGKVLSARRLALAAAAFAALAVAGSALAAEGRPDGRVVGGQVADPADWPFAGALQIKLRHHRKVLDCGASVIAPRYAITAAHCAVGVDPRRFSLVIGRPNLRRTGQGAEVQIKGSKIDPHYGPPYFRNDVAILKLMRRVSVTPVALPTRRQDEALTKPGSPLQVAGWGGTRPNGSHPAKRLQTMTETAIKPSKCRHVYGPSFSNETTICTRGPKRPPPQKGRAGACYGDSGGPLVADTADGPLLVGAVSGGGLRCGTSPDYYARIADALGFIRRETGVEPGGP
jgi:secreted trypsin-like serine protease